MLFVIVVTHFRACLKLITDNPKEITEELELIESIALLGGFGVNMLPIQVRMCKDRLDLVKMALDAKPFTYMNSQRVRYLYQITRQMCHVPYFILYMSL